ncbi:hypothetical protein DT019_03335 [Streptomyces sp. SDr-06]|uniref:hypothetical protein n=1 Tax=Streptomyces sp. SDr-06 TaxID=2267702 RepID=UPI000DE860EF|nr:hypothetical protein [Streptomyces sp. SDr-06]RCH70537.1 hypothetical protein DT019_03335 [Streptomyces sp. SDr-06]
MTTPTNPIERLDVPLARLDADVKALVARQRARQVLETALTKTASESDRIAYAGDLFLIAHPEACSTDADYPNWQPGRAS